MQLLLGTLAALFLVQLLVSAGLLWLVCKVFRADRPVRYRRALLAVVVVHLGTVALLLGAVVVLGWLPAESLGTWPALLGLFAFNFLAAVLLVLLVLRLSPGKALLVTLGWEVLWSIESVAVVFLLRLFLMDAYAVPTGNMAETLRGYHKEVECPSCGTRFAVNASREAEPGPLGDVPERINGCTCPGCRQEVHLIHRQLDGRAPRPGKLQDAGEEYAEVEDTGVRRGDRFLVGKGPLAGGGFPRRFDLVIFRYPEKPEMLYVKRLAGLPGETVAIRGGDVYALPPSSEPPDEARAQELMEQGRFDVLRKSPEQVLSTRVLVYDNDHPAKDLTGKEWQRWAPGAGWAQEGSGFRHQGEKSGAVRYRHLLRGKAGRPTLVTDFMGYNSGENLAAGRFRGDANGIHWVGDLILECEVQVEKAEGEFRLELVRAGEAFEAVWDLQGGACELRRSGAEGPPVKLDSKPSSIKEGKHRVRFADVDRRLIVWVDDVLVFGEGVDYSAGQKQRPTERDLSPAAVGADRGRLSVSGLRLYRDLYVSVAPNSPDVRVEDWGDPATWEGLAKMPMRVLPVPVGHYACLGDNSLASSDSRSWGPVPERNLLGKAWCTYLPWSRARPLH
jgi:signal peptidase I